MSANAVSLQLWAEVQFADNQGNIIKKVKLDVIRCATNMPLNDRPKCSLAIALGRRADDPSQASPIHLILDQLVLKQKVFVYVSAKTMGLPPGSIDPWPAAPFVLFEGATTGFGYRRTSSGAEYVLSLE